jgi:hypothetical protein
MLIGQEATGGKVVVVKVVVVVVISGISQSEP